MSTNIPASNFVVRRTKEECVGIPPARKHAEAAALIVEECREIYRELADEIVNSMGSNDLKEFIQYVREIALEEEDTPRWWYLTSETSALLNNIWYKAPRTMSYLVAQIIYIDAHAFYKVLINRK